MERRERCVFDDADLDPATAAELRLLKELGTADYAHHLKKDGWDMTDIMHQIEALMSMHPGEFTGHPDTR